MPQNTPSDPGQPSNTVLTYFELLRLPNVFTAMADVAMGFLFVREPGTWSDAISLVLLLGASSLLYLGGMALNDVCDAEIDAQKRPLRPIPSGRISYRAAARLSSGLLLAGLALGWITAWLEGVSRPGWIATGLLVCIMGYNGWQKTTFLGPPLMGACRLLNVLLGMSLLSGDYQAVHWLVAGGIGVYVTGLTWFARSETQRSPRLQLAPAAAIMLGGIALLALLPQWSNRLIPQLQAEPWRWTVLVLLIGAIIGYRSMRAIMLPDARHVQTAVVLAILSLIILDATVCYAVCGPWWAAGIIFLLLPAMVLSWWISPT